MTSLSPASTTQSPNSSRRRSAPQESSLSATACFNCRESKHKCDRQQPCRRCSSSGSICSYPTRSNRGRQKGSLNRPTSVDKVLRQIDNHGLRQDILQALLQGHATQNEVVNAPQRLNPVPSSQSTSNPPSYTIHQQTDPESHQQQTLPIAQPGGLALCEGCSGHDVISQQPPQLSLATSEQSMNVIQQRGSSLGGSNHVQASNESQGDESAANDETSYSPLYMLAEAIPRLPGHSGSSSPLTTLNNRSSLGAKFASYYDDFETETSDWEQLSSQHSDDPFKLEKELCDPVSAGIMTQEDAAHCFDCFFRLRHPFLGLFDPSLTLASNTRERSFTLFTTMCALGAAVSSRTRDRLIYPLLWSLTEKNIAWCLMHDIRSLELVQALICICYWSNTARSHMHDKVGQRIGHAVQLARDIGLHRGSSIAKRVQARHQGDLQPKWARTYQRTWFIIFVMDKSFGTTMGRVPSIAWHANSTWVAEWCKSPLATTSDVLVSGMVEMRLLLASFLEDHRRLRLQSRGSLDPNALLEWQANAYQVMTRFRETRCHQESSGSPTTSSAAALSFYVDHALLTINSRASRDVVQASVSSDRLTAIHKQTVLVASRQMDTFLSTFLALGIQEGIHNTQLLMLAHGAIELLHVNRCEPMLVTEEAVPKRLVAVSQAIARLASVLPSQSHATLFSDLFACLADSCPGGSTGRSIQSGSSLNDHRGLGHTSESEHPFTQVDPENPGAESRAHISVVSNPPAPRLFEPQWPSAPTEERSEEIFGLHPFPISAFINGVNDSAFPVVEDTVMDGFDLDLHSMGLDWGFSRVLESVNNTG